MRLSVENFLAKPRSRDGENKMKIFKTYKVFSIIIILIFLFSCEKNIQSDVSFSGYQPTPEDASPWVYWYWDDAAVSKEGITADLEAMKEIGLGGAYLFFVRGASEPPVYSPPSVQLTSEWWDKVKFAFSEAKRTGIPLGLHSCDGFTVAGGPWITPELSMQKVVWADTIVAGNQYFRGNLKQPETMCGYYEDIKVFAYPSITASGLSSYNLNPEITTDIPGVNPQFINDPETTERLRNRKPCWIQYKFEKPFTCRTVAIRAVGNIFQSHRLIIEVSDDGQNFTPHCRLKPHRQGWMDDAANITHSVEPVTAKIFRFIFDPDGTEPGAEDLDAAKWPQELKIAGIELSSTPRINQYEGKNGSVWRIAGRATPDQIQDSLCVPAECMIDISEYMDENSFLNWEVPPGNWTILRMGHTSTGKENYIGGGGKGLECDKFNPEAVKLQFNKWIGEFYNQVGEGLVTDVLKIFHIDSWECGSQNWSPVFADEFEKRRGYSLLPYLPVMAGIPVQSADFSENVLHDIRMTISELLVDNFYGTFAELSHKKGLKFSAESVAPVMASDAMQHFRNVDFPMGEFWLNSPTHDKPNDVLDAVSAGHIYGKNIIQAESFTEIRLDWNEYPGMLKTLGDRNFALGINRMAFHVFNHNPWIDRKPGMTLGVVGLFFQPTQTWFYQGKAWVDYLTNCQQLLQQGVPVTDIVVFAGEEIPRRAVLPDRLVPVFSEVVGDEVVEKEKVRLQNKGIPIHEQPRGVENVVNISNPADWVDPLHGYAYDSFNRDALLRLASVNKGRIELPGGASYSLLVIPGSRRMMPDGHIMSPEVARKLLELIKSGATVLFEEMPEKSFDAFNQDNTEFDAVIEELFSGEFQQKEFYQIKKIGKGAVLQGPYRANSFSSLGIEKDFYAIDSARNQVDGLAWAHRTDGEKEIYFISNQQEKQRKLDFSFRVSGKVPVFYFPVTEMFSDCKEWHVKDERTIIPFYFEKNESVFVIFEEETSKTSRSDGKNWPEFEISKHLNNNWKVKFDPQAGGPEEEIEFEALTDWSLNSDERIRYYSGEAVYSKNFNCDLESDDPVWLDVGEVHNLTEVFVNGKNCGVIWTAPFRVNITKAMKPGVNELKIVVVNTWANRLIGDHSLPEPERITWTTAAYRLEGQPLLPAGLLGPVKLLKEK